MNVIRIDGDQALALLRTVVDAAGEDYVYGKVPIGLAGGEGCRYQHGGEPSCLVGRALFAAGVSVEQLVGFDDRDDSAISDLWLPEWLELTPEARGVFSSAQVAQDEGQAWGLALSLAAE